MFVGEGLAPPGQICKNYSGRGKPLPYVFD